MELSSEEFRHRYTLRCLDLVHEGYVEAGQRLALFVEELQRTRDTEERLPEFDIEWVEKPWPSPHTWELWIRKEQYAALHALAEIAMGGGI